MRLEAVQAPNFRHRWRVRRILHRPRQKSRFFRMFRGCFESRALRFVCAAESAGFSVKSFSF
jgi:hypothetical protein